MTTPNDPRRPDGRVPEYRPAGNRPVGARSGGTPPGRTAPPSNRPVGNRPPTTPPNRGGRTVGAGPTLRGGAGGGNNQRTILLAVAGVAAALVILFLAVNIFGGGKPTASPIGAGASAAAATSSPGAGASTGAKPTPVAGAAGIPENCPKEAPEAWKAEDTGTVVLSTSKGDITIKLTGKLAPHATANFAALAECGYYDGVVFHRLVPGFVIQGGDGEYGRSPGVNADLVGTGGPGYTIPDDKVTTQYKRGTVAMARTNAPNSQGSQFFVVLSDEAAQALAAYNTYAIMGEVTDGLDAVDAIAKMPNAGGQTNAAINPIPITKATVTRP